MNIMGAMVGAAMQGEFAAQVGLVVLGYLCALPAPSWHSRCCRWRAAAVRRRTAAGWQPLWRPSAGHIWWLSRSPAAGRWCSAGSVWRLSGCAPNHRPLRRPILGAGRWLPAGFQRLPSGGWQLPPAGWWLPGLPSSGWLPGLPSGGWLPDGCARCWLSGLPLKSGAGCEMTRKARSALQQDFLSIPLLLFWVLWTWFTFSWTSLTTVMCLVRMVCLGSTLSCRLFACELPISVNNPSIFNNNISTFSHAMYSSFQNYILSPSEHAKKRPTDVYFRSILTGLCFRQVCVGHNLKVVAQRALQPRQASTEATEARLPHCSEGE